MTEHKHTNALANESSPYLLQHAHNPVNWQAWNDDTWAQAKREDKLVIVSVGYSACHWCHVMEHESFEDEVVARIMNDHFVSIKVDREERPDVDQIYMDACQLISGQGGWPLNAITLPDGRPLYAGTYFPRENWKLVLLYFVDYFANKRDEAFSRAAEITNGIRQFDAIDSKPQTAFTAKDRDYMFERVDANIDYEYGGRRGAPKFPMPVTYQYLLQNFFYTKNERALKAVTVTLDGMMNGGIYDQMGGGFARYSVDAHWEIPHFEKMLYDNGQLVSLYSDAYRITKNERYKDVVYETLAFVERELSDASGGFYSALDADSEGEEGKFYVWTIRELEALLGADLKAFTELYNVEVNFEGHINLTRKADAKHDDIEKWKAVLLAERSKRIRPGLDDKILTSWNALMLKGYVDAYIAFGEESFLARTLHCAGFIKSNMIQVDGSIKRNYKNGKVTISGFLDDYALTAEAFIALYQATFNEEWLNIAKLLAEHVVDHFYNLNTGLFFYTSINDSPLIARKTESQDNVIPSSNSSMAKVLYRLGLYFDNNDYIEKARRAVATVKENVIGYPSFYANWASVADWVISEPYEVAIVGEKAEEIRAELSKHFLPNAILLGSVGESTLSLLQGKYKAGETYIYICKNKACQLPVKTVGEALKQLL